MKLFKSKPRKLNAIAWNMIIMLLVLIGPILFLLIEHPASSPIGNEPNSKDKTEKSEETEEKPSDYSI
jgi:hypothetical protein